MNIVCSSGGIVHRDRPAQGIMDIAGAGFTKTSLDLAMYCSPYFLENEGIKPVRNPIGEQVLKNPKELPEVMAAYLQMAKEQNLEFQIGWATSLPQDTKRRDRRELLFTLLEESIRVCGKAGCRKLLVQPLYLGDSQEEILHETEEFYLRLVPLAKQEQVMLLFSNQVKNYNGHFVRGLFSDGMETARWLDDLNAKAGAKQFGFLLDTAICSLCGQNMCDFALALGHRIKVVTLSDCPGEYLVRLMPFSGARGCASQTDWLSLIRGLRAITFDGDLMIDFCDTVVSYSPILRPQVMQLAKATAEFLKWQVEIENVLKKYPSRVLFGAGNMCRNYMKCYGKAYPPLYTCDNDEKKWGTKFCGLVIQSPECLRELPEDTVILICNVYYREIERQLRNMGIANPIEYFNDEYMPSFHFDRVEDIMEQNKKKEENY